MQFANCSQSVKCKAQEKSKADAQETYAMDWIFHSCAVNGALWTDLLSLGGFSFLDGSLDSFFATMTLTVQFFLTLMFLVTCHYDLLDISALHGLFFLASRTSYTNRLRFVQRQKSGFPLTPPPMMSIFPPPAQPPGEDIV